MKLHSAELLEVGIIEGSQGFAVLEEEWDDLYRNSPSATAFQSWAWLYSWWEVYGKDYELRLVTVRAEELLVGIVPLMLEHRRGFGRLLFVGTGITDNLDLLAREGWEAGVSEAGARALGQMGSWQVADLHELRPEAAGWGMFRQWHGPWMSVRQDGCPMIDVEPWDELLKSLSSNLRSTVRRAIRRAEADGVHCRHADVTDVEQAARRLIALHRELWEDRGIGSEHLTPRFESLMIAAARRMISREMGGISEFWRDGEVLISNFWVLKQDVLGTYVLGASQEALKRYQWSSLYIKDAVDTANSKNASHVDLLRGEEPYKLRWSSSVVPTHRIILGRHRLSWQLYTRCLALYLRTRRYALSEDAPPLIKSALVRYRAMRAGTRNRREREHS